ncbi:MAG: tyrosine--tRNA ligase [Lachnospiraceae bacterium]|nr:tyrosine--tRNA ligase [Lachnospiraceae bacterium]
MFLRVEKKILELGSGIYIGVVTAMGLDNLSPNEKIRLLLREEVEAAAGELGGNAVKEDQGLQLYRRALNELGVNPSRYPCSIESILTRISRKGEFPAVSPVVDLGNYISIKYRVPVGVHDMDTLQEDLWIRLTGEEDCQIEENHLQGDELRPGEPVYVSGHIVRTRRWIWRQMPAGRVAATGRNFLFPIDGFYDNREQVEAACAELVSRIREFFSVEAEFGVINRENDEIRFGSMTEEEKEIENQIAIMLKGVAQSTAAPEIRRKLAEAGREGRPLRVKLGLDPSAPDIHIGHSVVLRKIRQLQDLGHRAVIIIGDYTGMIGDPTGKSRTRKQLSREDVERNAETYLEQIFKIIDRDRTEVHFNSEWLSKMNFGDVIELAAKCTVARMLERDDFNNRYTNHLPLSVHEFFYPLMQAYDSVAIEADIELGGTDQTFNILMGRNIQRDYGQTPQLTLFMPLLEGIDGVEKMSKSLGNYVGISEPAAVIYEKIMKIPDSLIIKYYNLCTDVHPDEVAKLQKMLEEGVNPRDVKMMLALEITGLYAGKEAADQAQEHFKMVYQKNQMPEDVPSLEIDGGSDPAQGEQILNLLAGGGFYKTKSEARRVFLQGGAQVDGEKVTDVKALVLPAGTEHTLKMGKNRFFKILVR